MQKGLAVTVDSVEAVRALLQQKLQVGELDLTEGGLEHGLPLLIKGVDVAFGGFQDEFEDLVALVLQGQVYAPIPFPVPPVYIHSSAEQRLEQVDLVMHYRLVKLV